MFQLCDERMLAEEAHARVEKWHEDKPRSGFAADGDTRRIENDGVIDGLDVAERNTRCLVVVANNERVAVIEDIVGKDKNEPLQVNKSEHDEEQGREQPGGGDFSAPDKQDEEGRGESDSDGKAPKTRAFIPPDGEQ